MAEIAPIMRFFGDGEHSFMLGPDEIGELERVTGAGIGLLSQRVVGRAFSHSDVLHLLRLALIGGGSTPETAHRLVEAYAARRPLNEYLAVAVETLGVLWDGVPEIEGTDE